MGRKSNASTRNSSLVLTQTTLTAPPSTRTRSKAKRRRSPSSSTNNDPPPSSSQEQIAPTGDEIKQIIAQRLKQHTSEHWLEILNAADIWCAEVLDWPKLCATQAFEQLAMLQTLKDGGGIEILTTRIPIRVDGSLLTSEQLAPRVGQHTEKIQKEFVL